MKKDTLLQDILYPKEAPKMTRDGSYCRNHLLVLEKLLREMTSAEKSSSRRSNMKEAFSKDFLNHSRTTTMLKDSKEKKSR
jgi:hypothetical protein